MIYRFGDCELDEGRYELRRGGVPCHLEPQVFEVLAYLVRNRGRLVTKAELLDEIWGSRFVSESALTSRLKAARRAVGDSGREQRVIGTVHGRGYRFLAPVQLRGAEPREAGLEAAPVGSGPARSWPEVRGLLGRALRPADRVAASLVRPGREALAVREVELAGAGVTARVADAAVAAAGARNSRFGRRWGRVGLNFGLAGLPGGGDDVEARGGQAGGLAVLGVGQADEGEGEGECAEVA